MSRTRPEGTSVKTLGENKVNLCGGGAARPRVAEQNQAYQEDNTGS